MHEQARFDPWANCKYAVFELDSDKVRHSTEKKLSMNLSKLEICIRYVIETEPCFGRLTLGN